MKKETKKKKTENLNEINVSYPCKEFVCGFASVYMCLGTYRGLRA